MCEIVRIIELCSSTTTASSEEDIEAFRAVLASLQREKKMLKMTKIDDFNGEVQLKIHYIASFTFLISPHCIATTSLEIELIGT